MVLCSGFNGQQCRVFVLCHLAIVIVRLSEFILKEGIENAQFILKKKIQICSIMRTKISTSIEVQLQFKNKTLASL